MNESTHSRRRALSRLALLGVVGALAGGGIAGAAPVGTITAFTVGLNPGASPAAIGAGPDGNLWVADRGTTPALARITPAGAITEFSAGLNAGSKPADIDMGDDGNLWFTDQGTTKAIGRITPAGTITEFTAGLNSGSLPNGLTAGPDGNLWFADRGTTPAVGRITPDGTITEFPTGAGSSPRGIVDGPDGNLWFTDAGTVKSIGRITPDGMTITRFTAGLNPGSSPRSIDQGPDGNLWFNDMGTTKAIGRITTDGAITEFSAGLDPGASPADLGPATDGNVWFADRSATTPALGRITPAGVITEFPTGAGTSPHGIATGGDGNIWYGDDGTVKAIADFEVGAPAASVTQPAVAGGGGVGVPEQCAGATWSTWGGEQPSLTDFAFDGYQWLLDGSPIAGQTAQSYTPAVGDLGHQLSCKVTVTYDLFATTVSATSAAVTVSDVTPPVLSLPAPIVVNATEPRGAVVTFTVTATDNVDSSPSVSCSPSSGSPFTVGVTTVQCTAKDAAGNSAGGSFTVTVRGPSEELADVSAALAGANLHGPFARDMQKRLERATRKLGSPRSCKELAQFAEDVFGELGQSDTSLDANTAVSLLGAMGVEQALGCLPPGSSLPQAADDTVALIAAIDGLGQSGHWVDDLRTMDRGRGVDVVRGRLGAAGQAIEAIDAAIQTDGAKPGRLTATQANELQGLVAAVSADLGL